MSRAAHHRAPSTADLIEQYRARGRSAEFTAAQLDLPFATVLDVWARMDAAIAGAPDQLDPDPCCDNPGSSAYAHHLAAGETPCPACRANRAGYARSYSPIIIPVGGSYPSPPLSLNQRLGWQRTNAIKREFASQVRKSCLVVRPPRGLTRIMVTLHWAPAIRRDRDDVNPYPTVKAAVDVLVAYGVIDNDTHDKVLHRVRIEDVCKVPPVFLLGGKPHHTRVWLSIVDLSDGRPTGPGDAG